jgi:purine-binding chemotaxis protein CheW
VKERIMAIADQDRALEVLTLDLQGEIFALEAHCVREILDLVPITEVPGSQPFVTGLINVRGKVVPLADLRRKFGMEPTAATSDTRIVVIEVDIDGIATTVGLRADKVHEVTELAAATLAVAPEIGMRWRSDFIRCIGKRETDFVVVLDLAAIFATGQPSGDQPTPTRAAASPAPATR